MTMHRTLLWTRYLRPTIHPFARPAWSPNRAFHPWNDTKEVAQRWMRRATPSAAPHSTPSPQNEKISSWRKWLRRPSMPSSSEIKGSVSPAFSSALVRAKQGLVKWIPSRLLRSSTATSAMVPVSKEATNAEASSAMARAKDTLSKWVPTKATAPVIAQLKAAQENSKAAAEEMKKVVPVGAATSGLPATILSALMRTGSQVFKLRSTLMGSLVGKFAFDFLKKRYGGNGKLYRKMRNRFLLLGGLGVFLYGVGSSLPYALASLGRSMWHGLDERPPEKQQRNKTVQQREQEPQDERNKRME